MKTLKDIFGDQFEAMAANLPRLSFEAPADVQRWVDEHGGGDEFTLRFAMATHAVEDERSRRLADVWLLKQEQSRTDARAKLALEASERAAAAAEASARWTLLAAIVAAVSTVVTAAGVIVSALATPAAAPASAASSAPLITQPPAEVGPKGR